MVSDRMRSEASTVSEYHTTGSHWSGTAKRRLNGKTKAIAVSLALIVGIYHIFAAGVGVPGAFVNRPIHLTFMMSLVFIWYSPKLETDRRTVPWYDWILVCLTGLTVMYLTHQMVYADLASRAGNPLTIDIIIGVIGVLLVLEMTRRMTGVILTGITILFLIYAHLGPLMPGLLAHRGYSIQRIISHQWLTTEGVFGLPLGVSATFIILFIIFGAFLEVTGVGDWFIDVAYGITGRLSGGPAKTAVLASGFMGSLNGSAVANTATTGAFTIPLMKKTGFSKAYAGAVESAASVGGQVLPPVMAAAAFIMAAWTGISYATIVAAATIPAILYFLSVFTSVHFRAKKQGLEGLPASQLPDAKSLFFWNFTYVVPILVLVFALISGYSAIRAGFYAIISTLLIVPLTPRRLVGFKQWFESDRPELQSRQHASKLISDTGGDVLRTLVRGIDRGVQMNLVVAAACACAGIIVGVVSQTGLGLRFTSLISSLSGEVIFIALVLTMITSIILGMGLPTTAAYVVVAALGAPALTAIGVDLLAAHMFVLYFAVMSGISPPIMLAVFAASGIAESDPWKTAVAALKIAAGGFIIPFLFVYGSPLLLEGSNVEIIWVTLTAAAGVIILASGLQAYLFSDLGKSTRILLIVTSLGLLSPEPITDIVGIGIAGLVIMTQYRSTDERKLVTTVTDRL